MDKKTRIFFGVLAFITIVSVAFIFNRAFITKDYDIIPIPEDSIE